MVYINKNHCCSSKQLIDGEATLREKLISIVFLVMLFCGHPITIHPNVMRCPGVDRFWWCFVYVQEEFAVFQQVPAM